MTGEALALRSGTLDLEPLTETVSSKSWKSAKHRTCVQLQVGADLLAV